MRNFSRCLYVGGLLLLIGQTAAHATAVLDQHSFLVPNQNSGAALLSEGSFRRAQTFTVGMDGTLDHISVHFNGAVTIWDPGVAERMNLIRVENGVPGTTIASTTARTLSTIDVGPQWDPAYVGDFDFSSLGLSFQAGDQLAFEIDGGWLQWYEDVYAGGSDFYLNPSYGIMNWTANTVADLGFQTYMTPVPLPSALLLLVSGIASVFGLVRRQF